MAKDKLTDYDSTASNNLDVGGISVAEGMLPSGVNNAIRELMSHQADAFGAGTPLYVDQTNNRLGVGNAAPATALDVTGTVTASDLVLDAGAGSSVFFQDSTATNGYQIRANVSSSTDGGLIIEDLSGANIARFESGGDISFYEDTGTTTKFFWDASAEALGIGTTSPSAPLHVKGGTGSIALIVGNTTETTQLEITSTGNDSIDLNVTDGGNNRALTFSQSGTERMRIDSSGNVDIAQFGAFPGASNTITGLRLASDGRLFCSADGTSYAANFNVNTDGEIIRFRHAGVQEGTISVSGTTVSYNGGHLARWSQLTDGTKDETIVKGTVLTNLDQMAVWHHEAVAATYYVEGDELPEITPATYYTEDDTLPEGVSVGDEKTAAVYAQIGDEKTPAADAYTEDNEQLNCMAVSSVEGDPNVAGVFVNWDNDDDEFNDMNIAMTGDMVIRIAQGTTVARGDLLMSAGDGTAKPQGDDIVRSKTIAKVTSTHVSHTYDDGSYLVPCVLMAC